MNLFPRSKILLPREFLAALFLAAAATFSFGQSQIESDPPLIEVQGRFFHVTKSQREAAFKAAGADQSATILTADQFKTAVATLKSQGINSFSEPRVITQSGSESSALAADEFRFPTKYEPSKKDPDKSVPVAFAMRLVGVTLVALATVDSSGRIGLKATPMFNKFLGFIEKSKEKPTRAPSLEDLLKAPLPAGEGWQPVFSTYEETENFDLEDGQTAVMFGPPTVEVESSDHELFVSFTVHKISRE